VSDSHGVREGDGVGECMIELHPGADNVVVDVRGEIDQATRDALAARLGEAITTGRPVQVDLTGVSFMDSWGLSAVLAAHAEAQERGVPFEVTNASRQVAQLFVITGVAVDFGWPTFAGDG